MTVHPSGPTATQLHQRTLEPPDHQYVRSAAGSLVCVKCVIPHGAPPRDSA